MDPKNAHNIEQCYRLLATCARAEGHPLMDEQLRRQVAAFTAWDELPEQAELHGMGPLLWHHLKNAKLSLPLETQRIISGLYLRHRMWNEANAQTLLEIISLLDKDGIRAILLKGVGLAYEYYPDPALRPSSDIDLLLKQDEILPALELLKSAGYRINTPQTWTSDLLPREIKIHPPITNGLVVPIELHHYDPRHWAARDYKQDDEFECFKKPSRLISMANSQVYVPAAMDTLEFLYRHFRRHSLLATVEKPIQLKWVADIISVVEHHSPEMDWQAVKDSNPALVRYLEIFYSFSPLPDHLRDRIPVRQTPVPSGVSQYLKGWPQYKLGAWKGRGVFRFLKLTFARPSDWWLSLYYGIDEQQYSLYGQVIYRLQVLSMMFWTLAGRLLKRFWDIGVID